MRTFDEYSESELVSLVDKLHNVDKLSLREIARQLKTYPVKLYRFCSKHDIPTLTKSESLKSGYESKRIKPHMAGKKRTEEEKIKIGEGQHKYWDQLSEEERNKRGLQQSEVFSKRTDKAEFSRKGCQAIRRAVDEGSKFEKALIAFFNKEGIHYIHHYKGLLPATKLEVDFYLPEHSLVIEVDGPSHFTADFGISNYASQMKADNKKNGLVLGLGASILRLRHGRVLYKRDYNNVCIYLKGIIGTLNNELRIVNVENI